MSIKTKILGSILGIPLIAISILMFFSYKTFEKDKLAYIFESASTFNNSLSTQIEQSLIRFKEQTKILTQFYLNSSGQSKSWDTTSILEISQSVDAFILLPSNNDLSSSLSSGKIRFREKEKGLVAKIRSNATFLKTFSQKNPESIFYFNEKSIRGFYYYFIKNNSKILAFSKQQDLLKLIFAPSSFSHILTDDNLEILKASDEQQENPFSQKIVGELRKRKDANINSGVLTLKIDKNVDCLSAFKSLTDSKLNLVSYISKDEAFSVLFQIINDALLFFLILASISTIFGTLIADGINTSISTLLEATQNISQGNFKIKVRLSSSDELGLLAKSFNLMAREIARLLGESVIKTRMESELKTAQLVQSTFFPEKSFEYTGVKVSGKFEPATECSGDWWYHFEKNGKVYILIGDATGHGVSAALVTSSVYSIIETITDFDISPAIILKKINTALFKVYRQNIMMTFFVAEIDIAKKQICFANASHEAPILMNGSLEEIKKKDLVFLNEVRSARLGDNVDSIYQEHTINVGTGDRIFLYTDGIFDIQNKNSEALKERDIFQMIMLTKNKKLSIDNSIEELDHKIKEFQAVSLKDDLTFLFIEIL
jgi:sigma-B regulation protein RsbU (phosphoserine phosphatase)